MIPIEIQLPLIIKTINDQLHDGGELPDDIYFSDKFSIENNTKDTIVQRVSAGHYQVAAHGFHYDVIKKDIPVTNWIILKNGERTNEFPNSIGRYGKAKELVYADIEKEESRKAASNVTDPNMAIQHLDTSGTDVPTGNAAGPANVPLDNVDTATQEPGTGLGSHAIMGEAESVERFDDDEVDVEGFGPADDESEEDTDKS